jgi:peroxinectin, putative
MRIKFITLFRLRLTKEQARDGLSRYSLLQTSVSNHCPKLPTCTNSKYRTSDGCCNNLQHVTWGQSHTTFERLLPPDYADGLTELRRASDNGELPSPREVTLNLAHNIDAPDNIFTLMVMQWGQFLDHDLTLTSSTRSKRQLT